jgi:hypothetical protein
MILLLENWFLSLLTPIRIVSLTDTEDQFLIEGILTIKTDSASLGYRSFYQPIAMLIGFSHGGGKSGLVDTFRKVMPSDKVINEAAKENNGMTSNFTEARPFPTPLDTATPGPFYTLSPSGMIY